MATLSFSAQYDMSAPVAWSGSVTAHDNSTLTIESAIFQAIYTSRNNSFSYKNGSLLPAGGTLAGFQQFQSGQLQYEFKDGKFPIVKVLSYLNSSDFLGLESYVLSRNDSITGSGGADVLLGFAGNDVIDGGAGADTLQGGKGNDTHIVDNAGDTVIELAKEGTDWVKSAVGFTLSDNVENLMLVNDADIIDKNFNGTGNALNNKLIGNDGDNILDGAAGKDTLSGGAGDDRYIVDLVKKGSAAALEDKIVEKAKEGTDTVELRAGDLGPPKAINLRLGVNLENLDASHTGNSLVNLIGNQLDNVLTGNSAANILDGGKGADTLIGGSGDDTYIIDNIKDGISEEAGGGTDTVKIKIATSAGSYTLGDNIENAAVISAVAFNVIGNDLNNVITGNGKNNLIEGGGGADVLDGGKGIDTVSYANSTKPVMVTINGKTMTTGAGGDAQGDTLVNFENITGSVYNDTLTGDAGANVLDGGAGADVMTGGDGNDTYVVDDAGDQAIEGNGKKSGNHDLVVSSIDYTLGDNLENLTLTGNNHISGSGNALNNTIVGNDGNNILNGGGGKNTLKGGLGDDTYVLDLVKSGANAVVQDKIIESADAGTDTLELHAVGDLGLSNAATLTLARNLEILDARDTGSNKLNLTGNAENNTLYGNPAGNILDGGAGADTLIGAGGDDTYVVDDAGDNIIEESSGGTDLVKVNITDTSNTSYSLSGNVENAVVISNIDFNLVGNEVANSLTGNSKNNVIEGGAGADTLNGGAGIDTVSYEHSPLGISLGTDSSGNELGRDSGVTVSLDGSNVTIGQGGDAEGDQLKHFENIIGSANNDVLSGDGNDNTLDGGGGVDSMEGGNGNDTYIVDSTRDVVIEENTSDAGGVDVVQSSAEYTLSANVENLTLTGNADIDGTGNGLDNVLIGNAGNNQLSGGGGDDTLDGGDGIDTLIGGTGDDIYKVDLVALTSTKLAIQDDIIENSNQGIDSVLLYFNPRNSTLANISFSLTLADNLENMDISNAMVDNLNLQGNTLDNTLIGNAKSNSLSGGKGNDILAGGDGADILTGGLGADIFSFDTAPSTINADHITDFSKADGDQIVLSQSIYANAGSAGTTLAATEFLSTTSPSATASQHIVYDQATGELFYNADGSGSGGLSLIGIFDNHQAFSLANTDISLI